MRVVRGFSFGSAIVTFAGVLACAGATPSPMPSPSPSTSSPAPAGPTPMVQTTWPARTKEHVDLWLHSYALLSTDTTLIPYFARGYRDRMVNVRRQRGVSSQMDANRQRLLARFIANPAIATSGQFVPLYFESWEQMRQVIDRFTMGSGASGTNDPTARLLFGVLASAFPSAADREWLRLFAVSADDEGHRFYSDYWNAETRARARTVAHTDSLWQRVWRPALQRFLNNTQQGNGELYLSLPLGGEGRTIHFAKGENVVAGPVPDTDAESEHVLYVFAHEVTGTIASGAIADNTTPAEQRSGATSRYEQAAAVRAGALLLERTLPATATGYMRYYLQQAGRAAPTDPRSAFVAAFGIPDAVRDAIAKQLDVVLGGI